MKRHRRVTVRIAAVIEVELELDGAWHSFRSVDLSLGGVCLQFAREAAPPLRQVVALRLHLPAGDVIATRGEICWIKAQETQLGVQFEGMAPADVLLWARFLKEPGA